MPPERPSLTCEEQPYRQGLHYEGLEQQSTSRTFFSIFVGQQHDRCSKSLIQSTAHRVHRSCHVCSSLLGPFQSGPCPLLRLEEVDTSHDGVISFLEFKAGQLWACFCSCISMCLQDNIFERHPHPLSESDSAHGGEYDVLNMSLCFKR